ncbi:MAG: hypothetical protein ACI8ZM_004384 [Crocinitomix sp.]|jgi:hypothetical protein
MIHYSYSIVSEDTLITTIKYLGEVTTESEEKYHLLEYIKFDKEIGGDSLARFHWVFAFNGMKNLCGFYFIDERWINISGLNNGILRIKTKPYNYDCDNSNSVETDLKINFPTQIYWECKLWNEENSNRDTIPFTYCIRLH